MTTGVPDNKNGGDHHADALAELRAQAEQLAQRIDALSPPAPTPTDTADRAAEVVPLTLPHAPPHETAAPHTRHETEPITPAALADPDAPAEDEEWRPGVRLADLPRPVAKKSRLGRALWLMLALLLVAAAVVAGVFLTAHRSDQSATSLEPAAEPPPAGTEARFEAAAGEILPS